MICVAQLHEQEASHGPSFQKKRKSFDVRSSRAEACRQTPRKRAHCLTAPGSPRHGPWTLNGCSDCPLPTHTRQHLRFHLGINAPSHRPPAVAESELGSAPSARCVTLLVTFEARPTGLRQGRLQSRSPRPCSQCCSFHISAALSPLQTSS